MQQSPQNWVLLPLFGPAAVVTFTDITNISEKEHEVAYEDWLPSKTAFNGSNGELTFRGSMNFLNKQANPLHAHQLETEGAETMVSYFVTTTKHSRK